MLFQEHWLSNKLLDADILPQTSCTLLKKPSRPSHFDLKLPILNRNTQYIGQHLEAKSAITSAFLNGESNAFGSFHVVGSAVVLVSDISGILPDLFVSLLAFIPVRYMYIQYVCRYCKLLRYSPRRALRTQEIKSESPLLGNEEGSSLHPERSWRFEPVREAILRT